MSEVISAAVDLAVKALMDKHGWTKTKAILQTPNGGEVSISVREDNIHVSVRGFSVLSVPLADPELDVKIRNVEDAIATNAFYSCLYACNVLKGPFSAGEAAIAQSTEYAYKYAHDVLMGPFPAGEAAIAANAEYAYDYARHVLKGPFPAGEEAIAANAEYACDYAKYALKLPEARAWADEYLALRRVASL